MLNRIRLTISIVCLALLLSLSGCQPQASQPGSAPTSQPQVAPAAKKVAANLAPAQTDLPPQIIERLPIPGTEAALDAAIELLFDQPMDQKVTTAAFRLTAPDGSAVRGKLTWPAPDRLRFAPAAPLLPASFYEAGLLETAASQAGVPMNAPYTFRFTTLTPLQVSQAFPAGGSSAVEVNTRLTVTFNRPVVALGIREDQDKLPQPLLISPETPGQGEWVSTSVYVFKPSTPLKTGTNYTVKVRAGLPDASGSQAAALAEDYEWNFTTQPPILTEVAVNGNFWDLRQPNTYGDTPLTPKISITFGQPMNQTSVTEGIVLKSDSGEYVPFRLQWNAAGDQVTLSPNVLLRMGSGYSLTFNERMSAVDGGRLGAWPAYPFMTIYPPGVARTNPSNGDRDTQMDFTIFFQSPMDFKSIAGRISFNPPLKDKNAYWYNEYEHSITFFGLAYSTTYQVTIKAGMLDKYGNAMNQDVNVNFTTGAATPFARLMLPYEAMFRTNGPQEFSIQSINIREARASLYRLSLDEYIQSRENFEPVEKYNPPETALVWQQTQRSSGKENEQVLQKFTLADQNGNSLPPGLYYLTLESEQVSRQGRFIDRNFVVIASANLTLKTSMNDALAWVTDFNSGAPMPDVTLAIYDGSQKKLATGTTGEDGLVHLDLPASTDGYASRYAVTGSGENVFVFTSSNWGSGASPEDFGIWGQYYGPSNTISAYIYTDRPLYRPGQPVYFKGIVRVDQDLAYSLPDQSQVEVVIRSFDKEVYREKLPLSAFGSFNGEFKLDPEAALGGYTLTAYPLLSETSLGEISFTVAEYRKPEFQVAVTSDTGDLLGGRTFTATVDASYYSGGGVGGAEVYWRLLTGPYSFRAPEPYSSYNFSDDSLDSGPKYYNPYEETSTELVAEGKGVTGPDGKLAIRLTADISKTAASQVLTLDAGVTDLSGFSVNSQARVNAHQSEVYPGIRSQVYIGRQEEPQTFDLLALDWNGKPRPGQKVSVVISEREWFSVQEEDAQGNLRWNTSVKDNPVARFDNLLLDEQGQGSASFTPAKGGVYRAVITALDRYGNAGSAATYLWVAGKEFIPWRQSNDRTFQLVVDRDQYQPGETAEILIASPFQGSVYALVTVERGLIRSQEVIRLDSNSVVYQLPVTKDMAPVVYVSVVVVKGVDDTNPRPSFKIGYAKINVTTAGQALNVEVTPDKQTAGPGEQVVYTVRTTGKDGKPVRAEVSLGLSDLATLSLLPANSVPILNYFYSPRALSVMTSVPIVISVEDYNAVLKAQQTEGGRGGSGGGKGEGTVGVPDVRQDFPDTAFWKADVLTGEDGRATVQINLPDNLTTWRMDARAATTDTRVGQTTQDIISTRPLLVRPQTPRFFVSGDQVTLGMAVHNNTGKDLSVDAALDATGITLLDPARQTVEIKNGSQAYLTWKASVPADSQRVDLIFSAKGGDYADASRPTIGTLDNNGIPVYRYEAPESVSTAGELKTSGSRVESIRLPGQFDVTQGSLQVTLEPSLAASMTAGLTYLEHYPYECAEQTVSRFLPNVLTTQAMKTAGLSDPKLEDGLKIQVNTALQKLYNQQNSDGGWGWWAGQQSHDLTTAYVVLGLVEAQNAGYSVDGSVLSRGISSLRGQLNRISAEPMRMVSGAGNRQAFLLYVLAKSGAPNVSRSVQLYEMRQSLHLYGRAYLAQALFLINPKDTRLNELRNDLVNAAILSGSGAHWQEKTADTWNWNTDTRTTAILLDTLIRLDPTNAVNANAVRWLMSNRQSGHWRSTQETAWTLMALTNWMQVSGELEGNYSYTVNLNGAELLQGTVNAASLREVRSASTEIVNLLKDQANALVFGREGDAGNLYYTTNMKVYLPVPEIKAMDQGLLISRKYYTLKDSKTPVTSAAQGDLLKVRLTVVIPNDRHYLIIEDPLPAGLEAVDTSLKTSPEGIAPDVYEWDRIDEEGWGWWYFSHVELRDEKLVLSTDYLPAGTYVYTYLARASTPGKFNVIPATGSEFYFPDVYGRGEGSTFEVKP